MYKSALNESFQENIPVILFSINIGPQKIPQLSGGFIKFRKRMVLTLLRHCFRFVFQGGVRLVVCDHGGYAWLLLGVF